MSRKLSVISSGLALFSMFFGAGNIVFPLLVGRISGNESLFAVLGLGFSAVLFPFLGLLAMTFYAGKLNDFLRRLGRWPALILLIVLQLSQGPFGAMPRLVTLMHASIKNYLPISLLLFSFLICAAIFILTVKPQRIIHLLGKILTPFLLLTLGVLIIVGSIWAPAPPVVYEGSGTYFIEGLKMGYQTTDLIAALLFAGLILPHLSQGVSEEKIIRRRMMHASLIASVLLMATYIGLCWISAHHCFLEVVPEELLQTIAGKILGPFGGIVSAVAIFLSCLTTAISLAAVFASFVREDVAKKSLSNGWSLVITLGLSALVANLGFNGIFKLWGPILEVLYPVLIVLCVVNIFQNVFKRKGLLDGAN